MELIADINMCLDNLILKLKLNIYQVYIFIFHIYFFLGIKMRFINSL